MNYWSKGDWSFRKSNVAFSEYMNFTIENGQKIGHLSQFQKLEGVQKKLKVNFE